VVVHRQESGADDANPSVTGRSLGGERVQVEASSGSCTAMEQWLGELFMSATLGQGSAVPLLES
jgi:hypothetical protein